MAPTKRPTYTFSFKNKYPLDSLYPSLTTCSIIKSFVVVQLNFEDRLAFIAIHFVASVLGQYFSALAGVY